MTEHDPPENLEALARRVRQDLELLHHPAQEWVPARTHPSGTPVHDVVVVGGGQAGLSILFALAQENVTNTIAFDRNPRGHEGPWLNFARMPVLRTNKNITGPALGIPSLTPRAWYSARYGTSAWDALERIPRTDWQAYLDWYRDVLDLPVRNDTEIGPLEPENPDDPDSLIRVPLNATGTEGQSGMVFAREVVLATGIEGCGDWHIPDIVTASLPADRYAQACAAFDTGTLRGKRVCVIGANASGFDIAADALESGALRVDLLVRRREIPKVNAHRPLDSNAWHRHFADLDQDTRWKIMTHVMRNNQPPPQDSFDRAHALPGFAMHEGFAIGSIGLDKDDIVIRSQDGAVVRTDFIIAATGFVADFSRRIETAGFADQIALWRDRHTPQAGTDWEPMGAYPWLEGGFAFQAKEPGAAPWLQHIYFFSLGTKPSLGLTGGSASSIRHAVPRLVHEVTRRLFLGDADHHVAALLGHDAPDLEVAKTPRRKADL